MSGGGPSSTGANDLLSMGAGSGMGSAIGSVGGYNSNANNNAFGGGFDPFAEIDGGGAKKNSYSGMQPSEQSTANSSSNNAKLLVESHKSC